MSAFIVEKETIERVGQIVDRCINRNFNYFHLYDDDLIKKVKEVFGIVPGMTETEQDHAITKKLIEMNTRAVNQRYNENDEPLYEPFKIPLRLVIGVQHFKSLQCYLYQCAEGDVYGSEFYNTLREVEKELAMHLVVDTHEYNEAEWG